MEGDVHVRELKVRVTPVKIMVLLLTVFLLVAFMSRSNGYGNSLGRLSIESHLMSRVPTKGRSNCQDGDVETFLDTALRIKLGRREDEPTKLKDNCLPCHVVDNVKTMVLFVGYPRSCHSLVGSLLDAHPNMVIAHEYNLLGKWRKMADVNRTRKHIFNDLYRWSHQQQATIRQLKNGQSAVARYLYGVPNQWQGDYKDRVTVIGDKRGGLTSRLLSYEGDVGKDGLETIAEVQRAMGIPIKFIHVVRNPFDNIATMSLRRTRLRDTQKQKAHLHNTTVVDLTAGRYFRRLVAGVEKVKSMRYPMLDIQCEKFIQDPVAGLKQMCSFLGVPCPEDYVRDSSSIVHPRPSFTRRYVDWTEKTKSFVETEMKKHSFLAQYKFET